MLLLELQNQQRLSTDDTVSKYIQQGKNDYLKKVTLKHLATHTSGLPRLAPNLSSKKNRYNPYSRYTEQDLLAFLADADHTEQIGSFEYSNTGMGLLGYILCKVTDSTYDALLKKYITNPLNMMETASVLNTEQNSRLVDGYTSTGKVMPHWDMNGVHDGAGAIRSSVHDMSLFLQANLNEDHALAAAMQQSHVPVRIGDSDLCFGWEKDKALDEDILCHGGVTFGSTSYVAIKKEQGVGVVLLSNYSIGSADRVDEYLDAIYKFFTKKDLYPLTFLEPVGKSILESMMQ
jgi:CubicO group peptidase (beta-lactamase class C family)